MTSREENVHSSIVIFIDEKRFDNDQNLVNVGPNEIVQLVQDSIDNLDQQMSFLILQSSLHQQGQDLVEKRTGTKFSRFVGNLSKSRLSHRWCTILDLEE